MDRVEGRLVAEQVLAAHLEGRTHTELTVLVDQSEWVDRTAPSGTAYAVKIYALWDEGRVGGPLRVIASASDGTRRFGFDRHVEAVGIVGPEHP